MDSPEASPPDVPPLDELLAPSPGSRNTNELLLLDRMARLRRNPIEWLHEVSLFVSGTGWRAYDQIVGQDCFYSGYTDKVREAVLSSALLQRRVAELAEARTVVEQEKLLLDRDPLSRSKRKHDIEASLYQIVHHMIDRMICKMESKGYIRTAFYSCAQLITRAYNGIYVSRDEVERLRQVAAVAAKKNQSIIFLPRHSSHIDYVSLHLICYRLGLTLPIVVAGDNLNFPLVGSFLQSVGAMWIRRSFDGDPLYTALVQAYLDTLLQKGYNLECFIEGTRSRTGKLLQPKFGILSFLLDSILSGRTDDAYICPVSLQYDKVVEVDSYVTELLGKPKQKENLAGFLSSSSVLSLNLGRIDCRFHEPWSLKEFIAEQRQRQPRPLQEAPTGTREYANLRVRLLRTLGYRVLSDINDVAVIMPSALVGTVLLTLRGRGVGVSDLIRRVDWLCERINSNGGQVAEFNGKTTQYMVERALEVLGPDLVGIVEGLAEPTYYAVDRFQLSFYRNMTIHLFLSESLIAAALYTKVKQGGGSANQCISDEDLRKQVNFLSQLFRGEFIFPVGQGIRHNIETAVASLVKDRVLELSQSAEQRGQLGLTSVKGREEGKTSTFTASLYGHSSMQPGWVLYLCSVWYRLKTALACG